MQAKSSGSQVERAGPQKSRHTVAYFTSSLSGICEPVWLGVVDAARERDVNLVCFEGSSLRLPSPQAQANVLYDLVTAENVDGLISWASSIGNFVDADEITAFHERYRPLPMVSIGMALEGIPSLLLDSYTGMREAIAHLIEVHGCRRLAFIRGPEDHVAARERYRAYIETLEAHDIPLDPSLVTPPFDWGRSTGAEVMQMLLDERKLRLQADFDGIVAANDDLLLGALDVLQAREIRVPGDVVIAGFNDTMQGRTSTPPLTSVAVSFHEVGYRAVETLLALMEGEEVAGEATVPSRLVVRRSCGCESSAVAQAAVGSVKRRRKKLEAITTTQREEILAGMVQEVGELGGSPDPAWAERLLDGFAAEMGGGPPGPFLSTLEDVLHQVTAAGEASSAGTGQHVAAWQAAVSALRRNVLARLDGEARSRAEDLWQQARVLIGETTQRVHTRQTLQAEQQTEALRDIEAALATTFDIDELMDVLAQELLRLGIPSCYLSLYEQDPEGSLEFLEGPTEGAPTPYQYPRPAPEWSRLVLACDESGHAELELAGRRFPSRQLVPEGMLRQDRWYSFVAEPLYLRENQLGFILFEVGPRKANVYMALRQRLSSRLYGALLWQERQQAEAALERAYAEVEQQVRERTAELKQEIEERARAQEESVRLQQEVIDAQRQALQELSTPIIPVMERVIVMPLIGSVDSMRARDITRRLLEGIQEHRAKVVILDITGVPIVDSGVASHLNKTIQAARLKGARAIVTGIGDAVAETIVDLGIDWSGVDTLSDLRTGLRVALARMGMDIEV